ncbi:MAG: beta-lactamase family protein, partial [Actinobacteria bacterium]|nr:beta-lactamase family protein [Actinomycetota bacterium]MBV9936379.1 beta-lactamase family protein [Actinomycetota bacterium]
MIVPGWGAVGLGVAAGVLVGLSDGNVALVVLGVLLAVAVGWFAVAERWTVAISAGLAAGVAAITASHANDGSLVTFAKASIYGLAVALVVVVATTVLASGSHQNLADRLARTVVLAAGVLVALILPSPSVHMNGTTDRTAVAAGMSQSTVTRIDRLLREELRRNRIAGLSVSIVRRDGALLERGYGVASTSRRAMTPRTPQIVASLSKSMTATAVATLVDAGKVRYDDRVQAYLPWFRVADAD